MPESATPAPTRIHTAGEAIDRLRAYASQVAEKGALAALPALDGELDIFLEEDGRFDVVRLEEQGPFQAVELVWKGEGPFVNLRRDVWALLAAVGHSTMFVDAVEREGYYEFVVVTGWTRNFADPDTHVLSVVVKGEPVEKIIEWKRRNLGGV